MPDSNGGGPDETAGQAALRLLMVMLGSAGLAADRSLFWTILSSYARNAKSGNHPHAPAGPTGTDAASGSVQDLTQN